MPKFLTMNSQERARHEQKELAIVAKQRLIERSFKSQSNSLRYGARPQTGKLRRDGPGINSIYNASTKQLAVEKYQTTAATSARNSISHAQQEKVMAKSFEFDPRGMQPVRQSTTSSILTRLQEMNHKRQSLYKKGEWDTNVKQLSLLGSSIGQVEQDQANNTLMQNSGI